MASERQLFWYLAWLIAAGLGTVAQGIGVWWLYAAPYGTSAATLATVFAAAAIASFRPGRRLSVPAALIVLSAACLVSGLFCFVAFESRAASVAGAAVLGALAWALAEALGAARRPLIAPALGLGATAYFVNPFRLAAFGVVLFALSVLGALVTIVHQGMLVAIAWAFAAAWYHGRHAFLYRIPLEGGRWWWAVSLGLAVGGAASLFAFDREVPANEQWAFPDPVVFADRTPLRRYVVTRGLWGYELYVDGQLEVSSLDAERYFEPLVHPAMLAAASRRTVLLLEGGTGLAEREILRYPDVERLTVVVSDPRIAALAREQPWLVERSGRALDDPRVQWIAEEPAVWLTRDHGAYDVVIADVSLPVDYVGGKYATRFLAKRLRAHVAPNGAAAMPALSPLTSRDAHSVTLVTLSSAGLEARPYHAPTPSFGHMSFVLLGHARRPPAEPLPSGTRYLNEDALAALFTEPRDSMPTAAEPALLYDQAVVHRFWADEATP